MAGYKLVRLPTDVAKLEKFVTNDFGPLLMKLLESETKRTGIDHDFDMQRFMVLWQQDSIRLLVAYEDDVAVGFMLMHVYMPMFHQRMTLTIEKWYAENPEVELGMFQYIENVQAVMSIDQIHVVEEKTKQVPGAIVRNEADSFMMVRIGE